MKILKLLFPSIQITVIALTLGTVFFLMSPPSTPNTSLTKEAKVKISRINKAIYLDPAAFTDREIMHVIEATGEWNTATNGFVNFHVELLPQRTVDFRTGLLLMKVNRFYPDILYLDSLYDGRPVALGLYRPDHPVPHILLVEGRAEDYNFKITLEHELGHALGLQHDVGIEGINTIMNPGQDFSSDHITRRDLDRLCIIYKCDSKAMYQNAPDE